MAQKKSKIILGIETSCDETAAAIIEALNAESGAFNFKILSSVVSSQIKIHRKYGGVVPEIAARNHIINIIPVIDKALREAKIKPTQINKIAVTCGPGLITSLMVGLETAKALSCVWKKPLVPVNHLKAHIFAAMLPQSTTNYRLQTTSFPALALIVSGGHTEIILIKNKNSFKKIGQTLDDAAGEAFDKVAKILGLGYPGGPEVSKTAKLGNQNSISLPRPMINSNDFNFSFSGLKTAVLYATQKQKSISQKFKNNMAASFQKAVTDILVQKTIKAVKKNKVKTFVLAGGVAANKLLRENMKQEIEKLGVRFIVPDFKLCTDNAAMIAVAGFFEKEKNLKKIKTNSNLEI